MSGSKDNRIGIVIGVAALLLFLLFFFTRDKGNKYDWVESYKTKSVQPYQLSLLQTLLEKYMPEQKNKELTGSLVKHLSAEKGNQGANFLFIGSECELDMDESDSLLAFVDAGGTAMISSFNMPEYIMETIYYDPCDEDVEDDSYSESDYEEDSDYEEEEEEEVFRDPGYDYIGDTIATLNFNNASLALDKALSISYVVVDKKELNYWQYWVEAEDCNPLFSPVVPLGTVECQKKKHVNFLKIPHGKGNFYFHATPLVFTNFWLRDTTCYEYCSKLLSHMPEGELMWKLGRHTSPNNYKDDKYGDKTPLQYILSQAELRWAWYILLGTAILFLLFQSKRRQRIIPVADENENTSLVFIKTLGRLSFQQSAHSKLAAQKMKLFLLFIRNRYQISSKTYDEPFFKRLSLKAELPLEQIEDLFKTWRKVEKAYNLETDMLVTFHQKMDWFYKNCK